MLLQVRHSPRREPGYRSPPPSLLHTSSRDHITTGSPRRARKEGDGGGRGEMGVGEGVSVGGGAEKRVEGGGGGGGGKLQVEDVWFRVRG